MRVWYNDAEYHLPLPSRVALATIMAEREEIYRHVPPLGEMIPVGDLPFSVDDDTPDNEDIAWEVHRLCLNRSGGTSGMRAEHLRYWLISVTQDDSPDATNWLTVVAIVRS